MPGHGAYALQVNFGSSQQPVAQPALNTIAAQPSQNPGSWSADSTGGAAAAAGATLDVPGRIRLGGLAGFGDFLKVNPALGWHRPSHTFGAVHPAAQHLAAHAPRHRPHPH
jgi:hypothetical protein